MRTEQADRDFARMVIATCKKTKNLGGERVEIRHAALSALALYQDIWRDLRKCKKYNVTEIIVDNVSDYVARKTIALKKKKEDVSDDISSDVSNHSSSTTIMEQNDNPERSNKEIGKPKTQSKADKNHTVKINCAVESCVSKHPTKGCLKTKDTSFLGDKLPEKSHVSFEHPIKKISSIDLEVRGMSLKKWNGNIASYVSHGLAEAINTCGANLLFTAQEVKKDIEKNKLSRQ